MLGARGVGVLRTSPVPPLGPLSPLRPLDAVVRRLRAWPVESQQRARRNAMLAATVCAARRAEREDVADYLAALARPAAATGPAPVQTSATTSATTPGRAVRG